MVGRPGFEPRTNWLKATRSSRRNILFLKQLHKQTSPHLSDFQYSLPVDFIGFFQF